MHGGGTVTFSRQSEFVEGSEAAYEAVEDDKELQNAEMEAKRLTLYSWLGFRYADTFPDLDYCAEQRVHLDQFIERSLAQKASAGRGEGSRTGRGRGDAQGRGGSGGPRRGAPGSGPKGGPRKRSRGR